MFLDSLDIIKSSLDVITKMYNVVHAKGNVDHNVVNANNFREEIVRQNLITYCNNDCIGLIEALVKYRDSIFDEYGIDIWGKKMVYSTASLAMKIYKTNYYKKTYHLHIPTTEFNDYAKCAYKGGSNQIFYRGIFKNRRVRSIDYNSMYPYCMTGLFPIGPYFKQNFGMLYTGQQSLYHGVYKVIVLETPDLETYFLCDKINGMLVAAKFTNYQLHITQEELLYAHKLGYKMYIIDAVISKNMGYIFKDFVEDLYEKRKQVKKEMKKHAEGSSDYNVLDG